MAHNNKKQFRVVRDQEQNQVRSLTQNQTQRRAESNNIIGEAQDETKPPKKKIGKKVIAGGLLVVILVIAAIFALYMQTYTKEKVSDTYSIGSASNSRYEEFAGGVLKYSRDGISYLNTKGEEQWNQSYQIKTPLIEANDTSAAVADRGGNDIMVFQKDGLKGEIKTTLPIEKIAVSEQGIVAAILKNESTPQVVCYDMAGNILVEHKASLTGMGYPMNVALSPNGEVMQVTYVSAGTSEIDARVSYFNFGDAGEEKTDHQVTEETYSETLVASGFFLDQSVSVAVADNGFYIYKGKETPKESAKVKIKGEIQSVFHSDKYIGLIVQKEDSNKYELCLYNTSGKKVLSKSVKGTYKSAKISGSQVILYDGKNCSIYTRTGVHRFEGTFDNTILEIFPVRGINKYIVVDANGIEGVHLRK